MIHSTIFYHNLYYKFSSKFYQIICLKIGCLMQNCEPLWLPRANDSTSKIKSVTWICREKENGGGIPRKVSFSLSPNAVWTNWLQKRMTHKSVNKSFTDHGLDTGTNCGPVLTEIADGDIGWEHKMRHSIRHNTTTPRESIWFRFSAIHCKPNCTLSAAILNRVFR